MNSHEIWQVEVQGHIYEANVEEIIEWIAEGSVMPDDKVRKGSLRWLKAEKVPELYAYFNSNLFKTVSSAVTTSVEGDSSQRNLKHNAQQIKVKQRFLPETDKESKLNSDHFLVQKMPEKNTLEVVDSTVSMNACSVHPGMEPQYFCGTCLTLFCKNCPESFGGKVKICIDCGGMCQHYTGEESLVRSVGAINKPYPKSNVDLNDLINPFQKYFSIGDFGRALIYPLKFRTNFILGAGIFMLLMLGQSVAAYGFSMYFPAIICLMLANTLIFACLANTLKNFSRGKSKLDFMPPFNRISIRDDVIHSFFLSLAVYAISFGLLIILLTGAFQYATDSEGKIEAEKQRIISIVLPKIQNTPNTAQISQTNQSAEQIKTDDKQQTQNPASENGIEQLPQNTVNQTTELQKLRENVKQNVQAKIHSELDKNSETENESFSKTAGTVMRLSLIYSVPIFLALLWAIFYFPVACVVAGYTKDFKQILNPLSCFDTARRLGWDYLKIILVFLLLLCAAIALYAILQMIFSPLDLPVLGNFASKIFTSVFVFYLWIVFSVSLGITLLRNSAKLNPQRK
jgi:hypothetical protein